MIAVALLGFISLVVIRVEAWKKLKCWGQHTGWAYEGIGAGQAYHLNRHHVKCRDYGTLKRAKLEKRKMPLFKDQIRYAYLCCNYNTQNVTTSHQSLSVSLMSVANTQHDIYKLEEISHMKCPIAFAITGFQLVVEFKLHVPYARYHWQCVKTFDLMTDSRTYPDIEPGMKRYVSELTKVEIFCNSNFYSVMSEIAVEANKKDKTFGYTTKCLYNWYKSEYFG